MDERLDKISEQLARVLSILDAKEQKKQVDRDRIKTKREEDAAETAKKRGAIVVDRLTGTFARDDRLPYEKWAYICLEFQSALDFLRWMIHEYLSSYYCLQDGRKRMIARNGNYWKVYKSCGTERLMTPTDMFGGTALKWDDMLEVGVLKWCFKHVMPVMRFCVNHSRLEFVHEHKMAWDDQKVNEECGAPLALEPRWWQKSARFREIMHACVSPYGCGYVRTSRGTLPIDKNQECLERPETRLLFKSIYNTLREGVVLLAVANAEVIADGQTLNQNLSVTGENASFHGIGTGSAVGDTLVCGCTVNGSCIIDADGVLIEGVEFRAQVGDQMTVSFAGASQDIVFRNCRFDGSLFTDDDSPYEGSVFWHGPNFSLGRARELRDQGVHKLDARPHHGQRNAHRGFWNCFEANNAKKTSS